MVPCLCLFVSLSNHAALLLLASTDPTKENDDLLYFDPDAPEHLIVDIPTGKKEFEYNVTLTVLVFDSMDAFAKFSLGAFIVSNELSHINSLCLRLLNC